LGGQHDTHIQKSDARKIGEVFIVFGGVIVLLFGVLYLLNFGSLVRLGYWFVNLSDFIAGIGSFLQGIVLVALSLVVLDTCGAIKIPFFQLHYDWLVILVIGALMFLFGGHIGALIVIVGSILLLL
jgi:hypothetical protein